MSDESPSLRIVPSEIPVSPGTERVVAELTEMVTGQVADAYVAGFKLGCEETLKVVAEHAQVQPELRAKIAGLLDQWAGGSQDGG